MIRIFAPGGIGIEPASTDFGTDEGKPLYCDVCQSGTTPNIFRVELTCPVIALCPCSRTYQNLSYRRSMLKPSSKTWMWSNLANATDYAKTEFLGFSILSRPAIDLFFVLLTGLSVNQVYAYAIALMGYVRRGVYNSDNRGAEFKEKCTQTKIF